MSEEWRSVPGHDIYEVSNKGNVRRIDRTHRRRSNGNLSLGLGCRYPRVALFTNPGRVYESVHDLVARAFIGPKPEGIQVDHIDGNTKNNCVENLRYVTCKENNRARTERILRETGKAKIDGKLRAEDVVEIRRLREVGVRPTDIARQFKVAQPFISQIVSRVKWSNL